MIRWLLIAWMSCAAFAQPAKETVLFDGVDTSHWSGGVGDPFPTAGWTVEGGALRPLTGAHRWPNLYSKQPYTNFDLSWEWKLPSGGNSGVKYQCEEGRIDPDLALVLRGGVTLAAGLGTTGVMVAVLLLMRPQWFRRKWLGRTVAAAAFLLMAAGAFLGVTAAREYAVAKLHPPGFEYQMIDDETQHGDRLHTTGSLYDLLAAPAAQPRPLGEWNHSRIVVNGTHVEHWLNGQLVLTFELGSAVLRDAVGKSKFRYIEGFAEKGRGYLMLQHHGTAAWFRNIRITAKD